MKNGAISNGEIIASSEFPTIKNHKAFQGRLHFQETPSLSGSWSAAKNDANQWLQIDLGSLHTSVTGEATQGRNGHCWQWVTNYKLQYSNDKMDFQCYREQ